ncbi:exonuclease SbcD [Thermococcus profundus]|uniref:Exonuclease SbcD n=1 Tax=Thermococcus profundus TaxID=49899 RepID=A0A2Z2MAQ3_THEPR|nr:metallophosphoesterase [Thermococcus profundus]ASJ02866.1 exonuclease SbcD [Thermococcus profundus]
MGSLSEYFASLSLELKTSAGRLLVIADPHIGFEFSRGLRVRTHFEEALADFILEMDPDLIVILGDVKEPLGLGLGMKKLLMEFFSPLKNLNVVITKGNHDGRIEDAVRPFKNVCVVPYFTTDGLLFLHGHTALPDVPFEEAYLGHIHPAYTFKSGGIRRKTKVFVRAGRFLILPSVNPYIEGFDIREGIGMVPFLRGERELDLFLPEGLHIGRIQV